MNVLHCLIAQDKNSIYIICIMNEMLQRNIYSDEEKKTSGFY